MNVFDYLQLKCAELSENKIFIGLIMILVNLGARFIIEELSDEHRAFIKSNLFRKVIIFCSVFMATRDILVSLVVTGIFVVVLHEVFESETPEKEDKSKPNSAKQELDKQIDQLKLIKDSL